MQATMSLETGENLSLTGFMAIGRKKLRELLAGVMAGMANTDELELVYLHLQSMRSFNNARERPVAIQEEGRSRHSGRDGRRGLRRGDAASEATGT